MLLMATSRPVPFLRLKVDRSEDLTQSDEVRPECLVARCQTRSEAMTRTRQAEALVVIDVERRFAVSANVLTGRQTIVNQERVKFFCLNRSILCGDKITPILLCWDM